MITINGVPIDPSIYSKGEKGDRETKTINKEFQALNLFLSGLVADITIEPSSNGKIEVKLTATQSVIDDIEFEHEGNDVQIFAKNSWKSTNVINVSKNCVFNGSFVGGDMVVVQNGSVINRNGDIHITDDSSAESKAQLTIKAPCDNEISVDGVTGDVTIGKLNCNLEASIDSSGMVRAETVRDLGAKISGSGHILAEYVSGDAHCKISGNGKITISSGNINKLKASISGNGNAEIMATAKTAKLSVSGVGNIHVKHVLERPKESCTGMGNIRVDSVG